MSDNGHFDFKKHWLALTPDEREAFAQEAGTTSHYIQTHLTGKRKMPGKVLMDGLLKPVNQDNGCAQKQNWHTSSTHDIQPQPSVDRHPAVFSYLFAPQR